MPTFLVLYAVVKGHDVVDAQFGWTMRLPQSGGTMSCQIFPTLRPLQGAMSRTPLATVVATKGGQLFAWPARTPVALSGPTLC